MPSLLLSILKQFGLRCIFLSISTIVLFNSYVDSQLFIFSQFSCIMFWLFYFRQRHSSLEEHVNEWDTVSNKALCMYVEGFLKCFSVHHHSKIEFLDVLLQPITMTCLPLKCDSQVRRGLCCIDRTTREYKIKNIHHM